MSLSVDAYWMQQAFNWALQAQKEGEVPVGAVLISAENRLIGKGWNRVINNQDATAHAEILAIKEASAALNNYRLLHTTLYVTLEPCCMCAGALVHARIERLVFATRDVSAGAAGSLYNFLGGALLNHRVQIDEGVLQKECAGLLQNFFRLKRKPRTSI